MKEKIALIQSRLKEEKMDGWLIYDFEGRNKFFKKLFLEPAKANISRRFFYWIPERGDPEKIVHFIEKEEAATLVGKENIYSSHQEIKEKLEALFRKCKRIALDYTPHQTNPMISIVDGGLLDILREFRLELLSSGPILQSLVSILSEEEIESHIWANKVIAETLQETFRFIRDRIQKARPLCEYEVSDFILSAFSEKGAISEGRPICARGANSALPHYSPKPGRDPISKGDFLLIDLGCKKRKENSIYADITQVAKLDSKASAKEESLFAVVKEAQRRALTFIRDGISANAFIRGSEVDSAARVYIMSSGLGPNFLHRLGHSIDSEIHGSGTNLDGFEMIEDRHLMPSTCFSIEPGIYLPDEIGIRLETNVVITSDRKVKVTGGEQDKIHFLL